VPPFEAMAQANVKARDKIRSAAAIYAVLSGKYVVLHHSGHIDTQPEAKLYRRDTV
jgi:acetylornithine deacetylase/succinyl-diaminopimelate desuccinylase-like protein